MTYSQQYISILVGNSCTFTDEADLALALVSTQDAKFRDYDHKTIDLHNSSGEQTGTYTFSGSFIWIHFNVFAVKYL